MSDVEVAALKEISRLGAGDPGGAGADTAGLSGKPVVSFFAVGRALGVHHQTVRRCVERAAVEAPMTALDERARQGTDVC
jgi:hypothetical protein